MTGSLSARAAAAWDRFWHAPAPAINLAAVRVIIALHALWILGSRDHAAISGVPAAFWAGVPAGDRWRYLLFPGHATLEAALQGIAFGALIAAVVGVWPRIACFVAGLLLYHLAPLETIIWTPNPFERGFTVAVPALLALSFSRCGDALCLWPRRAVAAPPPASGDYRWPVSLVQLLLCQVYFFAGWAKLVRGGIAWAGAANHRAWLLAFAEQDQVSVFHGLGFWVADHPVLCGLIGASALALDLGLIAILVWPRLRPWLIAAALGFHAGILLVMGILFLNIPQWLVFVNWDRLLLVRGARDAGGRGRPA